MTGLDWVIVGVVLLLALLGWVQGFVAGVLSLVGFAAGAWLGTRIGPLLLSDGSESPYAPLFGLVGALVAGGVLAAGLEGVGARVRRAIEPVLGPVDSLLGAALTACVGLGIAWVLGAIALHNGGFEIRRDVQRSTILQRLNAVLPPSGPLLNALARIDPFPSIDGPQARVAPPRAGIARDPDVAAAATSVVKILGTACGLGIQGTGWVAAPGLVVTNAHVVAGQDDTQVLPRGRAPRLDAQAVHYDPRNDVAVLRVQGLGTPALALAPQPRSGTAGAVLGFPGNGPYTVRAARLGATRGVISQDAYGRGPVSRQVTAFRGTVRSGNSGGPMVDSQGRVVTTVFAATTRGPRGGYGVPNRAVRAALNDSARPVSTGGLRVVAEVGRYPAAFMGKTLVIAEKPSVGRDLTRVLPGVFSKHEGYLESDQHVVTWAVGHLVQLAEPDEYDDRYKKWRMADLPIVPPAFKLVVRDERSRKQMQVIQRLLGRADVEEVVNACDAGREGELIFAWLYEKAGARKPVRRLWLQSMTQAAIRDAFGALRPAEELHQLELAARSRSEADWIVGMNATRAATIRLRSSFDGAVSLGRVQTPTLAILARREEEIRAFVPEPYWLVDASFEPVAGESGRAYEGRYHAGSQPRLKTAEEADAVVAAVRGRAGEITKHEKTTKKERPPLLYDLTSLQRDANTRFGFSARRTLAAAQRLYEEHKALTYPRTSSRFLPSDMAGDIKPTAALLKTQPAYARAAAFVTGLDVLPLGRVVNDAKVTDHHAIVPTRSPHPVARMSDDDKRVYDLVVRRFLAAFHPEAVFENTRLETTVAEHVFRTRGRVLLQPGWRGVYGEGLDDGRPGDDDEGADQQLPKLERGEAVDTRDVFAAAKETKPPRRYTDASLLGAMETAGKLVDDDELREAMKDSGIGTPATRAAIIERLIDVGYIEREARALLCTEKGLNVIKLLGEHPLTSPGLTGDWEHRLAKIEDGAESRERFMRDIASFAGKTVEELDAKLKDVRIPRANLGPCPVCGRDIQENRKGYSCWSREDPGCGFVIWKSKAGKNLAPAIARELIARGRTEKPVTGFKGRSGRSFRARVVIQQGEDGKWRVEFDEPWARAGAKPPESAEEAEPAAAA